MWAKPGENVDTNLFVILLLNKSFVVGNMLMWAKPGENFETYFFLILLQETRTSWGECGESVDVGTTWRKC